MDRCLPTETSAEIYFKPRAARRALSLRASTGTTDLPDTSPSLPMPWHDDDKSHEQRGVKTQQMIAASSNPSTACPRNAAELAVSLVGLVFPYDVRSMQRSLTALQARMREVEARVRGDEAATARVEQGLKTLEAEITTIRSLTGRTVGATVPPNVEARIKEVGDEMLAKAAANASNINDALQVVRSALNEINAERAQLLQRKSQLHTSTTENGHRPDENDISTASEDEEDLGSQLMTRTGKLQQVHDVLGAKRAREGVYLLQAKYITDVGAGSQHDGVSEETLHQTKTTTEMDASGSVNLPEPPAPSIPANKTSSTTVSLRQVRMNPVEQVAASQRRTSPRRRQLQKSVEHRRTEHSGVAKSGVMKAHSRRTVFTTYTKQTETTFRADKPRTAHEHRNFIWKYIDNMEDKEMSVVVQNFLCQSFPDAVSKSKGRGKPYRHIRIVGDLEWPQVLWAIKNMPVPEFL